jgi:hypothetical protein
MDAKATVKVGPFARGGKSRTHVAAVDHDFHPTATLTPVGIFLPAWDELFVNWLRVLQIPLTSCRIWRNLILQYAVISFK